MDWVEVKLHTTNEAMEAIGVVLEENNINGFMIDDPLDLTKERDTFFGEIYDLNQDKYPTEGIFITFYLLKDEQFKRTLENVRKSINALSKYQINVGVNKITVKDVDEEDWSSSWKKYYKPTKITENITIVPSWESYKKIDPTEKIIFLDPGMAFGTGTHPTTILSIIALEKYMKENSKVIDVGCGSGVLSIAAGILGAETIFAYDLDEVAVSSTKSNLALNPLTSKVVVQQNNLLEQIEKKVDLIVANILAEIIITFTKDAWKTLKTGGIFITSGIIKKKKDMVIDDMKNVGFTIIDVLKSEEWITVIAKKN